MTMQPSRLPHEMRYLAGIATMLAFLCHAPPGAAAAAEYAFRWSPSEGAPTTTPQATLDLLDLRDEKPTQFSVQYIQVKRPEGLPDNVKVIARERTEGGKPQTSYKLRAEEDLSAAAPTAKYPCILLGTKDMAYEAEMDVSWGRTPAGEVLPKVVYSRTCSLDMAFNQALARAVVIKPPTANCAARMLRYKQKGLKFEIWTMPAGKVLFEVSRKVKVDSEEERNKFLEAVVRPLLAVQATPSTDNKTELSQCP